MHAIISQVASSIVEKPSPAAMKTARIEGTFGCRSEPGFIIDTLRRPSIGRKPNRALATGLPRFCDQYLSKCTRLNVLDGIDKMLAAAGLCAQLNNPLIFAHGLGNPPAFEDVVAIRFFHVNILARHASQNGGDGMPVVGCADNQDINVGIVNDVAKIAIRFRIVAVFGFDRLDCLRQTSRVNICQRENVDILLLSKHIEQRPRPSSNTYKSGAQPLAGC